MLEARKLIGQLQLIYDGMPVPGRANEDAYFVGSEAGVYFVADGATERLSLDKIDHLKAKYGENLTGAAYAAYLAREVVAEHQDLPPRDMLLAANDGLRAELESVYGALTTDAFLALEPQLTRLQDDPRYIRAALPCCVATAVKIQAGLLTYAHAGDTALYLFYKDGRVDSPTADQIEEHDVAAIQTVLDAQAQQKKSFDDALQDEKVIAHNQDNAVYHNYVDETGAVDTSKGIGVIDGLPELEHYILTGEIDLQDVAAIYLCSDGAIWPQMPGETAEQRLERWGKMRKLIEKRGLDVYLAELRKEERHDADRVKYPRFKIHDDATGIYLVLE